MKVIHTYQFYLAIFNSEGGNRRYIEFGRNLNVGCFFADYGSEFLQILYDHRLPRGLQVRISCFRLICIQGEITDAHRNLTEALTMGLFRRLWYRVSSNFV